MAPYIPEDDDVDDFQDDEEWEEDEMERQVRTSHWCKTISIDRHCPQKTHADTTNREWKPSALDVLPVELIEAVFRCAAESQPTEDLPRLSTNLISVCRHFKNVASEMPDLWTTIVIPPIPTSTYHIPLYLERSKDRPLNVILVLKPHAPAADRRRRFQGRVKILYPFIQRWKTLRIIMEYPWKDISSLFPSTVPNVEEVWIGTEMKSEMDTIWTTSFPRIKSLTVHRVNITWSNVPVTSLRQLELTEIWWTDTNWVAFIEVARKNLSLRKLRISIHAFKYTGVGLPMSLGKISLPELEKLTFQNRRSGTSTAHFLNMLSALQLQQLTLAGTGRADQLVWDFGPAAFSTPELTTLTLRNVRRVDDIILPCLLASSSLTRLSIINDQESPEHFTTLATVRDLDEFPCPHLTYLATRFIQPAHVCDILQRQEFKHRRLTVWMHVDDIALPSTEPFAAFDALETSVTWLRENTDFHLFGVGRGGLYRDWETSRRRAWKEHSEAPVEWMEPPDG